LHGLVGYLMEPVTFFTNGPDVCSAITDTSKHKIVPIGSPIADLCKRHFTLSLQEAMRVRAVGGDLPKLLTIILGHGKTQNLSIRRPPEPPGKVGQAGKLARRTTIFGNEHQLVVMASG
jgi:hypothetical protein